jgi:rare lipoprotein A
VKTQKQFAAAFVVMAATVFAAGIDIERPLAATQCGKATWYDLQGRTASGEPGSPDQLAAAHRTLPFGTRVKVENLDNGRSVVVRINDRGPVERDRVIDLSRAAATQLGFIKEGLAQVRLTALGGDDRLLEGSCADSGAVAVLVPEPRERPQAPPDTMAARFALAFQEDDWAQAEMAKAIEALTTHARLSGKECLGGLRGASNCQGK